MSSFRHFSRIDTLDLKAHIIRKLGHLKADKYFHHLNRLLSLKLSKSEFNKLCTSTIGRENAHLHNQLIRSIIKNALLTKTPPSKVSKVGGSLNVKIAKFPLSPRKGRSSNLRYSKFRDRPSPLGLDSKIQSIVCDESNPRTKEQQTVTVLLSLGSRPLVSVEDGEEVEELMGSPSVQSRSPVRAPLGIPINKGEARKALRGGFLSAFHPGNCCNSHELPDTMSLKKQLEQKLDKEGLDISIDCVNLLNIGLDAFLKRLIGPCVELAGSSCGLQHIKQVNSQVISAFNGVWPETYTQRSAQSISASLLDFRVAMELNPWVLGFDWPVQLERICLLASEE